MDFIKILPICLLAGAVSAPLAQAEETSYENYVEGALQVYKQFQEPSIKESEKFMAYLNARWQDDKVKCVSYQCSISGENSGKQYAIVNKVKLTDEF